MTEVYFLNRDLSIAGGPIDSFVSLVFREAYYDCGDFTLVLNMDRSLLKTALGASFIRVSGRRGLGRIERISFSGDDSTSSEVGRLTVSGRMAESLLADRVIPRGTKVSGDLVRCAEKLVSENAGELAGARAIAGVTVAQSPSLLDSEGTVIEIDDQVSGQPLDEWLREVLSEADAGYCIVPDYETGKLVFSVYRGLDRTKAQTENSYAIFSTSFSSIGKLEFLCDQSDYKNFAYIAGEGVGEQRVMLTLDLRVGDEALREIYVDARDLQSSDGEETMNEEEYRALLLSRGRQRLASHESIVRLSGVAAPYVRYTENEDNDSTHRLPPIGTETTSSMCADVHYALGDKCEIVSESLGMSWTERITEITYIYEGTAVQIQPYFGTAYPDLRNYIKKCASESKTINR